MNIPQETPRSNNVLTPSVNRQVVDDIDIIKNYESSQLDGLREEIEYLKGELKSKDTIIKTLKDENNVDNKNPAKHTDSNTAKNKNSQAKQKDVNRVVKSDNKGQLSITVGEKNNTRSTDEDGFMSQKRSSGKKYRAITIIGDSTLKDCKAFKMKNKLQPNERLYIKSFSGATVEDMTDYVRPTMKREPALCVLHAGTNDLRSDKTSSAIANDIMQLAKNMKSDSNDIMVSALVARGDKWNAKAMEVNETLKGECAKIDMMFIEHSNILPNKHLNGSKLHLNMRGTIMLARNFLDHIKI